MTRGTLSDIQWLPTAALIVDPAGGIVAVNGAAEVLFAAESGALGASDLNVLFPDPADHAAILSADCGTTELRLGARRVTGVPFAADVDISRPRPAAMVILAREVRGGALLSESQRYLDVAFDSSPIGMALFDTEGKYVRVNRRWGPCWDIPRAELLGRRDQEITHPDDRHADVDAAWRVLRGELDVWQTQKRFVGRTEESSGRSRTSRSCATRKVERCAGSGNSRTSPHTRTTTTDSSSSSTTTSSQASRTGAACSASSTSASPMRAGTGSMAPSCSSTSTASKTSTTGTATRRGTSSSKRSPTR